MKQQGSKALCLELLRVDTQDEVIAILIREGYWDDASAWRLYGDKEANYSTAGSQQARPDAALVEKLINSVDAALLNECLVRGTDPASSEAPNSVREAVSRYFEASPGEESYAGRVREWPHRKRNELGKRITLTATGTSKRTSLTIADQGEGQSPDRLPDTILSINKENKQRIRFVQGKFNMGGMGVLRFSGTECLQLVISRRNPEIIRVRQEQHTDNELWSFTVVRRYRPSGNIGDVISSEFKYLAPLDTGGEKRGVLRFQSDTLPLMAQEKESYSREVEWGTAIKLYEYDIGRERSDLLRGNLPLLYRLDALTPEIALPVRVYDYRSHRLNSEAKSLETNINGLIARIESDRSGQLEQEPWSIPFSVHGHDFRAKIYVFNRGKAKNYTGDTGIIFTINGQTHGTLPRAFFARKACGSLSRIAKDLLLYIDCSEISVDGREDLFMSSRDRLSQGELRNAMERQLEEIVKNEATLRLLNRQRKEQDIEDQLSDERPLENVLSDLLHSSPTLAKIFLKGSRLNNPQKRGSKKADATGGADKDGGGHGDEAGGNPYQGKQHPTYFRFDKSKDVHEITRSCERGRSVRVKLFTDVENEYFERDDNPGNYSVKAVSETLDVSRISHSLNLHDGEAEWSFHLPDSADVKDQITIECIVTDDVLLEPFVNRVELTVAPRQERKKPTVRKKKQTGGSGAGDQPSLAEAGITLPRIVRVQEGDELWKKYDFKYQDACKVEEDQDEDDPEKTSFTFYVNMDNAAFRSELNATKPVEAKLLEAKFVYGVVLLGLALIHDHKTGGRKAETPETVGSESYENTFVINEDVERVTSAAAPILIPMIDYLGQLANTDVEVEELLDASL